MHRMTIQRSVVVLTFCAATACSVVGGCEDSAAKARDEVQVKLADIRTDLQQAMSSGAETPEAYQQSLNGIVTRLASLNDGEPGQQAAKSLLAADALRGMGDRGLEPGG